MSERGASAQDVLGGTGPLVLDRERHLRPHVGAVVMNTLERIRHACVLHGPLGLRTRRRSAGGWR